MDTATSNRPGTRFGPRQIRTESVMVRPRFSVHNTSVHNFTAMLSRSHWTGENPFTRLQVGEYGWQPVLFVFFPIHWTNLHRLRTWVTAWPTCTTCRPPARTSRNNTNRYTGNSQMSLEISISYAMVLVNPTRPVTGRSLRL